MRLTLLSRAYCHLCDEMLAAVEPIAAAHGAAVDVIDVDAPENAALEELWGDKVPALFAGAPTTDALLCQFYADASRVASALSRVPGGNPL